MGCQQMELVLLCVFSGNSPPLTKERRQLNNPLANECGAYPVRLENQAGPIFSDQLLRFQ